MPLNYKKSLNEYHVKKELNSYSLLVKFSNYVDDINEGNLYCNSLNYFISADDLNGLGDKQEGTINFDVIHQINDTNERIVI